MSDIDEGSSMAGIGVHRVDTTLAPDDVNHMENFNTALKAALSNFGRAQGNYYVQVTFEANVKKTNPGQIVEYVVKLT